VIWIIVEHKLKPSLINYRKVFVLGGNNIDVTIKGCMPWDEVDAILWNHERRVMAVRHSLLFVSRTRSLSRYGLINKATAYRLSVCCYSIFTLIL
jgi:hypothetical protein